MHFCYCNFNFISDSLYVKLYSFKQYGIYYNDRKYCFSTRYDVDEDELKRYDILTFIAPDNPEITYIKRLIGLPGETIEVKEGKVYADGVELDDSFIKDFSKPSRGWYL